MMNNMNEHFLTGFLKRANQYGIDENTAVELHEKYAGPVEDFKNMSSPGIGVTAPGSLAAGTTPAANPRVVNRSPAAKPIGAGTVSAGTVKATPGLRSGTEGAAAGFENLKNFLGFGK